VSEVGRSFAASAEVYDHTRRQLVPCFDDFYRVAVELAPFPRDTVLDVVDLGAGTGLLSAFFADAFPRARFTLVDVSDEMLAQARARFAEAGDRFSYVVADYGTTALSRDVQLVVSALSIHHLSDDGKRELFARIHAALVPGGTFVNADQILGATPEVEARNRAAWLAATRRLGVPEADLAAAIERMRHDRPASLRDQLRWLEEAGFQDVDCAYQHYGFAVFGGRRADRAPHDFTPT
jgi:tRNA (cmo5U34)-methyltransferase